MTDALWTRLADIVPDALERPPAERGAFLDAACTTDGAPDAALRAEAAALVAAATDGEATETLRSPFQGLAAEVAQALPPAARPERIGPWRITGVLGEGGHGTVYRAVRADGAFDREVALKLIRGGAGAARRLDAERRVLARLEHPGIARLYDGGTVAGGLGDGAPYLVMERVDGVPLTDAARALDLDARLDLMLAVCDAVAYAHRHLVVHRDLKPSNVLVDAGSAPRLLDFGIAHLLDGDDVTRTGEAALTPAYAAPEQLLRRPVTTATDVYALGVLLYEVIAGQRPYDLSTLTAGEAERVVCLQPPPPLASVADLGRLGDLDVVVMTALAKDPEGRYASAAALADDLRRVRDGLPPSARPATPSHRARLFVRRHRVPVLAAAAVALALVGGLGTALWQAHAASVERDRAEARFGIARDAARALLFEVHDAVSTLSGSTQAREVVLAQSVRYLDRLSASAADDVPLRVDLADAYTRVGSVQGLRTGSNLGRTPDAEHSFRRGLSVLPPATPLAAGDTLAQRAERVRARLLQSLGVVLAHDDRLDSALVLLRSAETVYARVGDVAPDDLDARLGHAAALIDLGDHLGHPHFPNVGRPEDAGAHYARAERLLSTVSESSAEAARKLSVVLERQGTLLYDAEDFDAALAQYERSRRIRQRLAAAPGADYDTRRDGGIAHEVIGRTLRRQGKTQEALDAYGRALAVYRTLAQEDPANVGAQQTLAVGHWQLATVLGGPEGHNLGRLAEARAELDRALAILRANTTEDTSFDRLVEDIEADRRALDRPGA